jgi:hypothetical protein
VKKAIESAEEETYVLQKPREAPVLGPYKDRIDEILTENERLPRKQRYPGYKIYEDLYEAGYRGSESEDEGKTSRAVRLCWLSTIAQPSRQRTTSVHALAIEGP